MELRASFLMGTDVVAMSVWPTDAAAALCPDGLPVEVRCVDQATAEIVEALACTHAAAVGPDVETATRHPARWVLHALVDRAEHVRASGGDTPGR